MKISGKTGLQERLAGEYVLGTLRGGARRRFERWMHEEGAVAMEVARWEARLAPMSDAVVPVQPPERLWRAIRQRLGKEAIPSGLWGSIAFWRGLGLLASGMTAALFLTTVLLSQQAARQAPVAVRAPAAAVPASYLAVLSDAKTQKPVLVALAGRNSDQLLLTTLDPSIHLADKSLELWALPPGGAPKSLGLVPAGAKGALKLASAADESLGEIPALAISLEPLGGSRTGAPTGPVLFTGPFIKYW
ncbi:MAG: anti-sigma factor [Candidatus Parcubacteria bacterium]|nr:anti-sigma factor [Burkholderiales bacterium]